MFISGIRKASAEEIILLAAQFGFSLPEEPFLNHILERAALFYGKLVRGNMLREEPDCPGDAFFQAV